MTPVGERRGRFLGPLFALFLYVALPVAGQSERLAEARQALEQSRYAEAERIYRKLASADPSLVEVWDGLATALEAQDRRGEAVALLMQLGQGLSRAGDPGLAIRLLERVVALAPQSAGAQAALGQALLAADRHEAAVARLQAAIALGERSAMVRLFLGAALWESGRFDEAEQVYRDAMARPGPGAARARGSLGALLVFRGRFEPAADLLREASAADGDSVQLRFDLARALEGAGETEAAARAYRDILELAPELADAHYRLALLLHRSGEVAAAELSLGRFRELYASDQERIRREGLAKVRLQRGWASIREGDANRAIELFTALPAGVESLHGLATAYTQAGRHAEAAAALERALRLDPTRRDLRLALGEERLAAGGGS